jgi:hypothetical protein
MARHRLVMAAGLALGLATTAAMSAWAQQRVTVESDDAAYCKKLASMYERYGRSANTSNSMDTNAAINNCNNERAAEAIPHLEKLLRSAGYRLPERAVGARTQ